MTNAKPYLDERRRKAAQAFNLTDQVVLIAAGAPIGIPGGADQTYPFRPHTEYFWLADRVRPGCILAFDPQEGWVDFVPEVSQAERVWEGGGESEGVPASTFPAWLEARRGRPLAVLGCPLPGVQDDAGLREALREALTAVRRAKDDEELARIRRACAATAAGHAAARAAIAPGRSEREIQIELEAAFFRAGAQRTAFGTIVGSGPNSAVLHFEPSARRLADGERVLIDAGAELDGYCGDVTRTYPAGTRFTPEQRDLYGLLLEAQVAAVEGCRAGTEFRELHLATARAIAEGLAHLGYLEGSADELVESGAVALFFPHGLGHLVGLGVRDASGYLPGRQRSDHPTLRYLRCDLPLAERFVTTIEPGIYFIPALLDDPELRAQHRGRVNWERVDGMRHFGGLRIEDDVLITAGAPEVLTAEIPKALADVEG
jgi:Xaa-Pro aminopeptidase